MGVITDLEAKAAKLRQRYSTDTTDHDGDGRMGGSRRGDTNMAKTKPAKDPKPAPTPKVAKVKVHEAERPKPHKVEPEPAPEPTREEIQARTKLSQAALGGL